MISREPILPTLLHRQRRLLLSNADKFPIPSILLRSPHFSLLLLPTHLLPLPMLICITHHLATAATPILPIPLFLLSLAEQPTLRRLLYIIILLKSISWTLINRAFLRPPLHLFTPIPTIRITRLSKRHSHPIHLMSSRNLRMPICVHRLTSLNNPSPPSPPPTTPTIHTHPWIPISLLLQLPAVLHRTPIPVVPFRILMARFPILNITHPPTQNR